MSTRGLISIQDADGKVRSIYCHFDMYLNGGGAMLVEHYNTAEKIEALLKLGSLSTLGARPSPESGEIHSYDDPAADICIAYHRDRGEAFRSPVVWADANDMLSRAADKYWADYVYLFRNGDWLFDTPYQPQGWRPVEKMLKEHVDE